MVVQRHLLQLPDCPSRSRQTAPTADLPTAPVRPQRHFPQILQRPLPRFARQSLPQCPTTSPANLAAPGSPDDVSRGFSSSAPSTRQRHPLRYRLRQSKLLHVAMHDKPNCRKPPCAVSQTAASHHHGKPNCRTSPSRQAKPLSNSCKNAVLQFRRAPRQKIVSNARFCTAKQPCAGRLHRSQKHFPR